MDNVVSAQANEDLGALYAQIVVLKVDGWRRCDCIVTAWGFCCVK